MKKPIPIVNYTLTFMHFTFIQLLISGVISGLALASTPHISLGQGVLDRTLSVEAESLKLKEILFQIEKSTSIKFSFNPKTIPLDEEVSLHVENVTLKTALNKLFGSLKISYDVSGEYIILNHSVSSTNGEMWLAAITVTGTVYDEKSQPLPGVNVLEKGTTNGIVTDATGKFSISLADENSILIFSFIGYTSQEVAVAGKSEITISLVPDVKSLDEVVVVGYGTMKKRDVIGSVSSIKSEELNQLPVPSVDAALQGKGGLLAMTTGGTPGAPARILVRGTNSISSGADPLFIIDGIPLTMSIPPGYSVPAGSVDQSALSTINPNDIESIEVLKDAAATAIYGSRGSNGVILITTKSGKSGRGGVTVNVSGGVSNLSRTPEDIGWVNTQEFFSIVDKARSNSGLPPFDPALTINSWVGDKQYITREEALQTNTEWFDEILRQGSFQEYNISTSQGNDKTSLYASLNYRTDNGVLKVNNLERYSARINADFSPLKNFTTGFRISLSNTQNNRVKDQGYGSTSGSEGNGGGFAAANNMALPFYKIYDPTHESGYWNPQAGFNLTALNDPKNVRDDQQVFRTIGGGYLQYNLPWVDGLSLRSEYAVDFLQSNSTNWISKYLRPQNVSAGTENGRSVLNYNYNLYASYAKTFGQNQITITAGVESQRSSAVEKSLRGENLPGQYQQLGIPLGLQTFYSGLNSERYLRAFFGRADYKLKDRYLLGVSMRRDGSSAFPENNRWATFTSLAAGWIISEESFWTLDPINFLKLRGSFGQTGNQSIPNIIGGPQWGTSDRPYGLIEDTPYGSYLNGVNATTLTWETTDNADGGIDFGLLENRINGSIAYYHRTVNDMLLLAPTPSASGVDNTWQNIGTMKNMGWEITLEAIPVKTNDFSWKISTNATSNKNKVVNLTDYADNNNTGLLVDNMTLTRSGGRLGTYYLSEYAGIDPEHGVEMIYEIDRERFLETGETVKTGRLIPATQENNLNHKILQSDKTGLPTYWGGLSNTLTYKGFDLTLFFTFQGGNYIYDEGEKGATTVSQGWLLLRKDLIGNTWEKPGDNAKYSQLVWDNTYPWDMNLETHEWVAANGNYNNGTIFNDKYLHKGDFVRLKTLQLGYSLPQSVTSKLHLKNIRLAITGTNLLTFTKFKGYDPEAISNRSNLNPGLVRYQVPNLRIFSGSLNITF
ncbi:MAG TPA: TonB-dependent receptor [Chryseolinea sp.]|nr:TonB-dependent receptor [Chryseolinea sp.]